MLIALARYGQMTAGSYCYIGPQGIVHGTVVRNWGKVYLAIPFGGGCLSQRLVTEVYWIAVKGCSGYQRNSHCLVLKKLVSFHSDSPWHLIQDTDLKESAIKVLV